ncbi:fimbrial biogenesis chaperone [Klebsiella huaxiensis]|uniref:Putative fimbrial chaperone YadV n=1 Tax=Klebsiella huaxiensis TaxID=2153354 RepID=A0A564MK73_9ENTR|nr:fimbria/pilus periplasmic chaperone [Klebsiella huaxiensis]VUS94276.1 putative fimbrial chaperone YadV [Klebsiella huaxiensis]VUT13524.1 putative fimbrial chaperone YadV [Klebsiella huaxiensis]
MFRKLHQLILSVGAILAFILPGVSNASIVVNGTRVIYPGGEREVTVKLSNKGKLPVLAQSWVDNGDVNAKPEKIAVPFILTPPVNRIEPDKSQTLRLSYTASPSLPEDRESVYWLNILEIPPANTNVPNRLQMAFRTRIKLFYRPGAIADSTKAADAAENLSWSIVSGELQADNPSPYYVSLVSITVNQGNKSASVDGEMIAPKDRLRFKLDKSVSFTHAASISYEYINDWGAVKVVNTTF